MLGICSSFFRRSYAFQHVPVRQISKTAVSMRPKKKGNFDSFYDNMPKSRSKQMVPKYEPRTDNQKKYLEYLNHDNTPIVLGVGPAGCGKTMFACLQAIQELKAGNVNKIILTRPIVPVEEEELGFLPGNLVKKMDPWTRPIFDIFSEFYQQHDIENMIHCGILEISPLAYMRGRTFKRSFIIADEMQNSTPNQMLMLTTRIGDNSKLVITGDLKQSDRTLNNGLLDIIEKLKIYKNSSKKSKKSANVELIELDSSDIQRSPIVSQILEIYNSDGKSNEYNEVNNIISSIDHYLNDNNEQIVDTNQDAAMLPKSQIPKSKKNNKEWDL
uniref:PhoH-like protein n=1 Tax=viral metagenome TaxID=1070528 RepID=A0A6C0FA97_9ZZZZ|tara:strand:+ start:35702 stop:36685 length:984 start_codon:yes stop_codon:yes gene_type:complete